MYYERIFNLKGYLNNEPLSVFKKSSTTQKDVTLEAGGGAAGHILGAPLTFKKYICQAYSIFFPVYLLRKEV